MKGCEDFAGCVSSLANVAAIPVALCIAKGRISVFWSSGRTFSSAGRLSPQVRAEEVSALEGSIRSTRRAPMPSEVEAHALHAAKHLLGM